MDSFWLAEALFAETFTIPSRKGVCHGAKESFWTDFDHFQILGGAGVMNNSISIPNY